MPLNSKNKMQRVQEHEQEQHKNDVELLRADIEHKANFVSLARYQTIQKIEYDENQQINRHNKVTDMREREFKTELHFSRELNEAKEKNNKAMLLRQHLRENSHELRELESKLRAAYTAKELAAQIAEKEVEKIKNKIKKKEEQKILQSASITDEQHQKEAEEKVLAKRALYKQDLQNQMIMQEKKKRYVYDEFLREKKMIDDILQKIYDEDQLEFEARMCRMKRTRAEMIEFKEAQEIWKRMKRDQLIQENIKIEEYLMSKATTLKSHFEEQHKKEVEKEEICNKIAQGMHQQFLKKQERDTIIQDLLEEEQKAEAEKQYRDELEKQIRQRLEVRQCLAQQIIEKEQKIKEEIEDDARYKQQLWEKLAEDRRFELLSDQKKRLKMLQLRKDIEDMMMQRRQNRTEEMQITMKLREQEQAHFQERQRLIEGERLDLLKEHVNNLIGFLPKGLLKPDDLPHLENYILK